MARRYFHGFDPGEADVKLSKIASPADPSLPVVHELYDAVALPGWPGLYDLSGCRIEEAAVRTVSAGAPAIRRQKLHKRSAERVTVPDQLHQVDDPVLLGGHLMNHFGHFIIESMSRMWSRDHFPDLPLLFTSPNKWKNPPAYGLDVLDALNLSERLLQVDKPMLFRKVICPGTAIEYRWKAYEIADEPHIKVADTFDEAPGRGWTSPVYLTRSGLTKDLRTSEAEPELEAELSRRGFEIVRPELLSLREQIKLFESAPLIVGTLGSALHTALFSRASGTLAVLNWGRGFEHYLLVDQVKTHTAHYIKSMQRRGADGEYLLDVGLTLKLMEQAGLLASRQGVGYGN